jgi:cell division septal protein FtsQ
VTPRRAPPRPSPRQVLTLVAGVVAIGLLMAAGLAAPRLLRRVGFFKVRQVEVLGTHYLTDEAVIRGLGLGPDASVFDPLGPIRLAASRIPGVTSATVERRLPGTLRVALTEARPVALTSGPEHLVLIDYHGRVLPFDPIRAPTSLPLASDDTATAQLLARMLAADASLYASIQWARLDHGDEVLDDGAHRIRMRPGADDIVIRSVALVWNYLEQQHIAWRELDARFQDRVFVRRGGA